MRALSTRVPPWPDDPGVADRRAALEAVFGALPPEPVAEVDDLVIPTPAGDLPARRYASSARRGLLVFLHGGAWVAGSIASHDSVCRALANRSGAVVVNVGYRLAPEHPFPAGLDDAEAAIRWAVEHVGQLGGGDGGVAIAGDSAGATLSRSLRCRSATPRRRGWRCRCSCIRRPTSGSARNRGGSSARTSSSPGKRSSGACGSTARRIARTGGSRRCSSTMSLASRRHWSSRPSATRSVTRRRATGDGSSRRVCA